MAGDGEATERRCKWERCSGPLTPKAGYEGRTDFCSTACRNADYRARRDAKAQADRDRLSVAVELLRRAIGEETCRVECMATADRPHAPGCVTADVVAFLDQERTR